MRMPTSRWVVLAGLMTVALSANADKRDDFDGFKRDAFRAMMNTSASRAKAMSREPKSSARCKNGMAADTYPCKNVDLLSIVDIGALGVSFVNDMWGWTDWRTGRDYALLGSTEGTSMIDVSNPRRPVILGMLPAAVIDDDNPFWRDIKVYRNHAFIVSEQVGHGMQVFDLRKLRHVDRSKGPVKFEADANYNEFASSHNIAINRHSGFAYVVGANTCRGGLEMIDIRRPKRPKSAGCFSDHGYVHDTQCVTYYGPDYEHWGKEICFSASSNADTNGQTFFNTISIVDVSDKSAPKVISNEQYGDGFGYSHQGWLTPNQRYYIHDDELDEFFETVMTTTTRHWDMTDLENPRLIGDTTNGQTSIDHNLYIRGRYSYASNYTSGLRIFDTRRIGRGRYDEVAYFDVYPENDNPTFEGGTWSNYAFFRQRGLVAVSSIDRGMFLLRPRLKRSYWWWWGPG